MVFSRLASTKITDGAVLLRYAVWYNVTLLELTMDSAIYVIIVEAGLENILSDKTVRYTVSLTARWRKLSCDLISSNTYNLSTKNLVLNQF